MKRGEASDKGGTAEKQSPFAPNSSHLADYFPNPIVTEGRIDFFKTINRKFGKGVTPEMNALVPIFRTQRPLADYPELEDGYARMLGIELLPKTDAPFRFTSFDEAFPDSDSERRNKVLSRPWKKEEYPQIARWVEEQLPMREALKQASECEVFFAPEPEYLFHNSPGRMVHGEPIPGPFPSYQLQDFLIMHSQILLGEGNWQEAVKNAVILDRLGHLMMNQQNLRLRSGSYVMAASRIWVEQAHLAEKSSNSLWFDRCRSSCQSFPLVRDWNDSIDLYMRARVLETLSMIKQEKIDISELRFFEIKKEQAPENTNIPSNTDWEQVVQATNDWFDRCVETLTPETLSGKIANLEIVASELEAWANEPAAAKQYPLIPAVLRRCVASYISSIPNSLKRAGIAQCFHEMARTEYALLAWKKQHEGELPGDLNELVPKIIDRLPLDPFTGKPFDYRIISGGHLLYSPGANQELDGRGEKFSAVFGTGDTDRYRSFFDYDNDDIAMVIIDDAF